MANPESSFDSHDKPAEPTVRQSILDVLREQRAQNPEYTSSLARQLWDSLPPEEQDFRTQAVKDNLAADGIRPESENYLELVGLASRTILLLEYEEAQVRQAEVLSVQFAQPSFDPQLPPAA